MMTTKTKTQRTNMTTTKTSTTKKTTKKRLKKNTSMIFFSGIKAFFYLCNFPRTSRGWAVSRISPKLLFSFLYVEDKVSLLVRSWNFQSILLCWLCKQDGSALPVAFGEHRGAALCCTVLYCTVLYSTILYCTVQYCSVQCCAAVFCTVLYSTVLYNTEL